MENLIRCGASVEVWYHNGTSAVLLLSAMVRDVCDVSESFCRPEGTVFGLRLSEEIPLTHSPQREFNNVVFCEPKERIATYLDDNGHRRSVDLRHCAA
jgi:hypothetical protein